MQRNLTVPVVATIAVACFIFFSVVPALPVSAQTPVSDSPAAEPAVTDPVSEDADFIPGRLIVGVDPGADLGASTLQASGALTALDVQVVNATDPCVAGAVAASDAQALTAVQSWQVAPGREDEAIALLAQQPGVRFVTRDAYMHAAQEEIVETATAESADLASEALYSINDPLYISNQWGPQRANFVRGWQLLPANDFLSPVRVAVIDSGVDFDHPDLAGRLLPGRNYIITTTLPIDENGHGTHVAGVIAAVTNNGQGMAGSASKALIVPYKVLDAKGNGSALNLRYSLCDAARDGARVVNMSVQIQPSAMPAGSTLYTLLKQAMDFAEERGVLLIAAGGNNRVTPQVYYPALFEEVVAVASLTVDNQRPDYGPIGAKVEIAAPGGDKAAPVLSTWPSDADVRAECIRLGLPLVQSGAGWYCGEYGTSMASPHVVGAAALLMSVQPSLTAAQVRTILTETATDVGLPATQQGAGLLNLEAAVRRLTRSNLRVTLTGTGQAIAYGSAPYTATLMLSNPSLEPLAVTGLITGSSWLSVTGLSGQTFAGTIRYGQPLAVPVVISPTQLMTGTHSGEIQLMAVRSDNSVIRSTPQVFVNVGMAPPVRVYMPFLVQQAVPESSSVNGAVSFSWETPISPTVYALTSTESVDIVLPFAFALSGPAGGSATPYTLARIHADGFVTFPDAATTAITTPGQNRCLPWASGGMQGVFGWWADLDAAAAGAEVSSFRAAADRFVIQYKNMASVGVSPAYRATFQIVLYQNGDVQLNYQQAPTQWTPVFGQLLPRATVGVQARNGLYRNQVACATSALQLGTLPQSGQSLRIKSTEVY